MHNYRTTMDIITPGFGLIFWTTIVFLLLMVLLSKFAWKPILSAVKEREASIDKALEEAQSARAEMQNLTSSNEQLLKEARQERESIVKEARVARDKMVAEAKDIASGEAEKIMTAAAAQIEGAKMAAVTELKNHVAQIAVDMAEKILRSELKDAAVQKASIDRALEDVKLN